MPQKARQNTRRALIRNNTGQMNTGNADLDALLNQNAEAKAAYERNLVDAARKGALAVTEIAKRSSDDDKAANTNIVWYLPLLGLSCKAQAKWESNRYVC